MPNERKNVEFPLWRKKMDATMFLHKCTTLPNWVIDQVFIIRDDFPYESRKDPRSEVEIEYRHKNGRVTHHQGWVVTTRYEKGRNDVMRLFIGDSLVDDLKQDFIMTYHRMKERDYRNWNSPQSEKEIPFFEFLDIEYNREDCRFIFVPHYTQDPVGLDRFTYLQGD